MKKLVFLALAAAALGGLGVLTFLTDTPDGQAGPPRQPAGSDIAAGKVLYADVCASCHGAELQGQPNWRGQNEDGTVPAPPHDETGHTWHHGDALLFDYTKQGGQAALSARGVSGFASGMPGFGENLSDQQIWDILAFIKSTWPERIRDMQATRTEAEQAQAGL
ncbi:cytochrome c [Aliiroseovarius crassostreae]|uniref:c-type cytochrome n=1 Tax=Aliiroseovarius crassostreae TaxID=154981 RepID=UPI0021FBF3FF|nr:cytochrome c [Aliiroseovarius crassostreae]UWQ08040.1 cytochrome c [Aliiroseovarius crassostreae]UWQ11142.1 cytochrome c [Aliiroseovarius crassostreae]